MRAPGRSKRGESMKRIWSLTTVIAVCVTVGAAPAAPALAQSPAAQGYDETGVPGLPPLGAPPTAFDSPPEGAPLTPAGPPVSDERLAFTGLDLPLAALLGGMLVAAGLLIRGRPRTPA